MSTPYRDAPPPTEADKPDFGDALPIILFLILGFLIVEFAPRNQSAEPEPWGTLIHHTSESRSELGPSAGGRAARAGPSR